MKYIKECEKLKKITHCPNEQVVALLSVIASNFAPIVDKKKKFNMTSILYLE